MKKVEKKDNVASKTAGDSPRPARPARKQPQQAADEKSTVAPGGLAEEPLDEGPTFMQQLVRDSPGWLTSLVVHMALLLILALWILPGEIKQLYELSVNPTVQEEEIEEIEPDEIKEIDVDVADLTAVDVQPMTEDIAEQIVESSVDDLESAAVHVELSEIGIETAPKSDLLSEVSGTYGGALAGRGPKSREKLAAAGGGSPASEMAVAMALRWLSLHQAADGGWSFAHSQCGDCLGQCPDDGALDKARNGATAMALLPFLGAGQTHLDGQYQETVSKGLKYLVYAIKKTPKGGSLIDSGGNMYSHGLAAITLCEAYAMTQDGELMKPAQSVLDYVVTGQDPVTGGWGYGHGRGNDTSVAGWQIMALKSGYLAYLKVPKEIVAKSHAFLDSVSAESGAYYGYRSPGKGKATTAAGLMCRMYLGWKPSHAALQRGAFQIAKDGPSGNLYRDYYAAQIMFQMTGAQGPIWNQWNTKMRDSLVMNQAKQGHVAGSWYGGSGPKTQGGRLYCTSLATLILEVYYRHMPISREVKNQGDFPE